LTDKAPESRIGIPPHGLVISMPKITNGYTMKR
jgi:hypothetical protein